MKYIKYAAIVFVVCSYFFLLQPKLKPSYGALAGFNSDCLEIKDGRAVGNDDVWGHTAELVFQTKEQREKTQSQAPVPGKKTWIFACITTTSGIKCTTGNRELDGSDDVFDKTEDYDNIMGNTDYKTKEIKGVIGGKNPTMTTTDAEPQFSNPPIYWYDKFEPGVMHKWFWLQEAEPPTDAGGGAGSAGALQQSTFEFIKGIAKNKKCTEIGWDPKGYVFDANTLYPVKGVSITISQEGVDGSYTDMTPRIGLSNPDISQEKSGQYSFYTPPGIYKLRITSSNATVATIGAINPLYKKIFTLKNPVSTIYQTGDKIVEIAGNVAVSHIPVSITNENMLVKDLSVISRSEEKSLNEEILFTGVLSHPKSLIKIVSSYIDKNGKTSQDATTEIADEVGEYAFALSQSKIVERTIVYLTKYTVTFSLNPEIYPNPGAQSPKNTFSGEVIPSYINGIAYDKKEVPLAKAIVGIYSSYSDNAMYYTSTDENGKFVIGSQHIPQFQYSLRYKKNTGEVIEVSASAFIKQNTSYFELNKIAPFKNLQTTTTEDIQAQKELNLIVGSSNPDMRMNSSAKKNSSPSTSKTNANTNQRGEISDSSSLSKTNKSEVNSQMFIVIVVTILILVMIAIGVFVVIKAKKL